MYIYIICVICISVESFINYHPADLTNKQNEQTKQSIHSQTHYIALHQSINQSCVHVAAVKLH